MAILAALVPAFVLFPSAALAAPPRVECGLVAQYVAPDAGTSTAGSLTFAADPPLVIDAAAVIDSAVTTNLPAISSNGAPTCLTVTTDANDVIVALAFVPEGTICGPVVLDAVNGFLVVASRMVIPETAVDGTPEFAALIRTAEASGRPLCITILTDAGGFFAGDRATTSLDGAVTRVSGAVTIGITTLQESLIGPNALSTLILAVANVRPAAVTVAGSGTFDPNVGGIVNATATFAITTSGCTSIDSVAPTQVVVGGQVLAWSPSSTMDAPLATAGRTGIQIIIDADGRAHLVGVVLVGCNEPAPPPPDEPSSEPAPIIPTRGSDIPPVPALVPVVVPVQPAEVFVTQPFFGTSTSAFAVFAGGTVDGLEAAVAAEGATGAWIQDRTGTFSLLIVGGPTFLEDAVKARFPDGIHGRIAVTLVRNAR